MAVSRCDILKLYRACMVYVSSLKYSDKGYIRDRIRKEFRQEIDEDKIEYYYNKGQAFLQRAKLT